MGRERPTKDNSEYGHGHTAALDVCDESVYPVIHRLRQVLTIQSVSTASAERKFSFTRNLLI